MGWYRVFHGFMQAKFPDGGSILVSRQFSILPQTRRLKNKAQIKSGHNWPKNKQPALLI